MRDVRTRKAVERSRRARFRSGRREGPYLLEVRVRVSGRMKVSACIVVLYL